MFKSCANSTATDARFFAQPNEFIPERWTTRKELVMDDSPFKPFSTGNRVFFYALKMSHSQYMKVVTPVWVNSLV